MALRVVSGVDLIFAGEDARMHCTYFKAPVVICDLASPMMRDLRLVG